MDELQELAAKYGTPLERTFDIHAESLFGPIDKMDRRGEVIFVLRRRAGRILLMTKSFYPEGLYRLPSGGIGHKESIEDALLREVEEETGLKAEIIHFLAVIRYAVHVGSMKAGFYSYIFELDAQEGEPRPDEDECMTGFLEIEPAGLREVARALRTLPGRWKAWGEFRALAHDIVSDLLGR